MSERPSALSGSTTVALPWYVIDGKDAFEHDVPL